MRAEPRLRRDGREERRLGRVAVVRDDALAVRDGLDDLQLDLGGLLRRLGDGSGLISFRGFLREVSIESGADADLVRTAELLAAVRRQQREGQRPYYRIVVAVEAALRRLAARARPEAQRREVA